MSIGFAGVPNIGGTDTIAGYIPVNTTYTVKTDGTGDFSKLSEALAFLENKWSTGTVTIDIKAGTYIEPNTIRIDTKHIGFPNLVISGAGIDSTIIQNSTDNYIVNLTNLINTNLIIKNMTIECTKNTPAEVNTHLSGFKKARFLNIKFKGGKHGLFLGGASSEAAIEGTTAFENCTVEGIESQNNSTLTVGNGFDVTFKNMPLGIHVYRQSKVIFIASTLSFTSVSNKTSIAINTQTADGYIYTDSGTI